MRQRRSLFVGIAVAFLFGALAVAGDGHDHGQAEMTAEMQAEMEAWMQYAAPAQEHDFLKKLAGNWKASGKFWMDPSGEPMQTAGVSRNELILGGRFLKSEYDSEWMGQPFHGIGTDGFDRIKGKYVSTWMDTMGTMMMVMEGNTDKSGKIRTMLAEFKDAMSGQMMKVRGVTTIVSDDEHRYEAYMITPEGEFKNMEIVYTRQ